MASDTGFDGIGVVPRGLASRLGAESIVNRPVRFNSVALGTSAHDGRCSRRTF